MREIFRASNALQRSAKQQPQKLRRVDVIQRGKRFQRAYLAGAAAHNQNHRGKKRRIQEKAQSHVSVPVVHAPQNRYRTDRRRQTERRLKKASERGVAQQHIRRGVQQQNIGQG